MANKNTEVFISYKIAEPRSVRLRDDLTKILGAEPYQLRVVTDVLAMDYMADLEKFMTRLGNSRRIVVILTDEYLHSANCMFELTAMYKAGKLKERLFPIVYEDAQGYVRNDSAVLGLGKYWSDQHKALKDQIAGMPPEDVSKTTRANLKKLHEIVHGSQDALNEIVKMRYLGLKDGDVLSAELIATHISKWVQGERRPPKPPIVFPWRKAGMGLLALAVLAGGIWGASKMFRGKADVPDPDPDLLRDSLYNDSIQKATTAAAQNLADSLRADSLRLVLEANTAARAQFIEDSLLSVSKLRWRKPKPAPTTAKPKTYTETAFGLNAKMVYVPGGTFTMGCAPEQGSDCAEDEKPAHSVTLSGYYVGSTEVTQRQWRAVMGESPSHFKGCDNCPVENVSWADCQKFIKKLNDTTGLNYHLPTEAQWEYAARGGSGSGKAKFAGGSSLGAVGWYEDNAGSKTHAVGGKSANELGLYDMSGNVWEWCSDWYEAEYYKNSPQNNPTGPRAGQSRVLRGGSWGGLTDFCRVSFRYYVAPGYRGVSISFRVARD